jgi:hypothetical protein
MKKKLSINSSTPTKTDKALPPKEVFVEKSVISADELIILLMYSDSIKKGVEAKTKITAKYFNLKLNVLLTSNKKIVNKIENLEPLRIKRKNDIQANLSLLNFKVFKRKISPKISPVVPTSRF